MVFPIGNEPDGCSYTFHLIIYIYLRWWNCDSLSYQIESCPMAIWKSNEDIYIYQVLFPVTFLGVLNDPFRGVK